MVGYLGVGAIGGNADGALQVGSPQGSSQLAVAVYNIGVRMMKYIKPSAGDDDVLRPDCPDEIRMARRATAMVRSFQDSRLQGGIVLHQIPLGFFGDVSRQQHAERSILDFPDHR